MKEKCPGRKYDLWNLSAEDKEDKALKKITSDKQGKETFGGEEKSVEELVKEKNKK